MTIDPVALTRSIPGPVRKPKKEPVREDVLDQLNRCRERLAQLAKREKILAARSDEAQARYRRLQKKMQDIATRLDFNRRKERKLEAILSLMKEKP